MSVAPERVSRPAIEKKRRRRVLVVTTCSPRPMRAVQRARLWAITYTASPGSVRGEAPRDRRQLVLPVATTIFAGRDGVIIPVRRYR